MCPKINPGHDHWDIGHVCILVRWLVEYQEGHPAFSILKGFLMETIGGLGLTCGNH